MGNPKETPTFKPEVVTRLGVAQFRRVLETSPDLNERGSKGRTALFLASRLGRAEHVSLLLSRGANPNVVDELDEAPLQAASRRGHLQCVEMLLNAGASIDHLPADTKTEYAETALCSAIRHDSDAVVELLLRRGANPNVTSAKRSPPLHAVAQKRKLIQFEMLVAAGADIKARGTFGDSLLCVAIRCSAADIVRKVISLGVDVNEPGCHIA